MSCCSCEDRPTEDAPVDGLLDRRIGPCEALCEIVVGDCGPFPNETIRTKEDCVRECATADGDFSSGWGYQQSTEADACSSEWQAHADCLLALSCEQQKVYWRPVEEDPPKSERACYSESEAVASCVQAHPCCEES